MNGLHIEYTIYLICSDLISSNEVMYLRPQRHQTMVGTKSFEEGILQLNKSQYSAKKGPTMKIVGKRSFQTPNIECFHPNFRSRLLLVGEALEALWTSRPRY